MDTQLVSPYVAAILLIIASVMLLRYFGIATKAENTEVSKSEAELSKLGAALISALPETVILPQNTAQFNQSTSAYWAKQASDTKPECVFRPKNVQELSSGVKILKSEFDLRLRQKLKQGPAGVFAVRGGGHSPNPGASSSNGGVLIDLSLLCDVIPSEDGSSVDIGGGAKWGDVYRVLDEKGLAVVGGRNLDVGVGGLTLGGMFLPSSDRS